MGIVNKLICVGFLGVRRCYLNLDREDAVRRYLEALGEESLDGGEEWITEFEFTDEFGAYDVYSVE